MKINEAFLKLVENNEFDLSIVDSTIKSICKKLNNIYYQDDSDTKHFVFAGSAGRGTLIKGCDIDCCFILPKDVFERFRIRKGNIQSQLLSEIASKIKQRYPNTDISSDGQVVDANFKKTLVEIVPSFLNGPYTQALTYADTHNDGSWLITNPINQRHEVNRLVKEYPSFLHVCKIIRCWRLENNVKISGIVIDSLLFDYFESQYDITYKAPPSNFDFLEKTKEIFSFLSSPSCPASVQIIGEAELKDTKKEKFAKKAKKAFEKMSEKDLSILWDNLVDLFGDGFPDNPSESIKNDDEMFIQDMFPVKISEKLIIDCNVIKDGFRTFSILNMIENQLSKLFFVPKSMSLEFYVKECSVQRPYKIYWKVRNVGKKARERNDIRGNIFQGDEKHKEKSVFHGPHYVECFVIKNGVCVARDKLNVPIE